MKKIYASAILLCVPSLLASAQNVPVAYTMSQRDLRGTARFMSMAGAFGALGGDLSCLSQNPGGIGVYRSNDVGFTLGLDVNSAKATSGNMSNTESMTRFNLNNIGGVFTIKFPSDVCPNINLGFTYNKAASFNRRYAGGIPNLQTSMSNYIAGISNQYGLTVDDVVSGGNYDPYNPPYGSYVPWLSIMGYDAFLTDADEVGGQTQWYGQYGDGTRGSGYFEVNEKGSIDEYNIAIGGNISDKFFWGMDFGITSIDYRLSSYWQESLTDAYIYDSGSGTTVRGNSNWDMLDHYKIHGTGFNYKLGFVYKPIQELRLGLAFHTPTFYNLTESYYDTDITFNYKENMGNGVMRPIDQGYDYVVANDGYPADNDLSFRSPWHIIASVAGVIGNNFILSADYEWASTNGMRYGNAKNYGYYDPWYDDPWDDYPWDYDYSPTRARSDWDNRPMSANEAANMSIKSVYKDTHTLRIGAEYRIIPQFSVRAGYSFTTSPIKSEVKNYEVGVPGTGIMSNYNLDNDTHNITCGIGYKNKGFYADLAYVYTTRDSEYFPFAPDIFNPASAVKSKVKFDNSRIALSIGFKF